MRYALSDRFWRNLLLTCVFTVFTLGFSIASWNGVKVNSPERAALDQGRGTQASAAPAGAADLAAPRADYARSGDVKGLYTFDGVTAPASFADDTATRAAGVTPANTSDAAVEETGQAGGQSRSSYSAASSGGGDVGSRGFPGPSFGRSSKKDEVVQKYAKTSPSSATTKSGGKGKAKGGGRSNKGPSSKTSTGAGGAEGAGYAGEPPATRYAAASPASTPEPLSMLLVGTGLAGLYRARKYLR